MLNTYYFYSINGKKSVLIKLMKYNVIHSQKYVY